MCEEWMNERFFTLNVGPAFLSNVGEPSVYDHSWYVSGLPSTPNEPKKLKCSCKPQATAHQAVTPSVVTVHSDARLTCVQLRWPRRCSANAAANQRMCGTAAFSAACVCVRGVVLSVYRARVPVK